MRTLLLLCPTLLFAAVAGAPVSPVPGPIDGYGWAAWGNDAFGVSNTGDDHRTNSMQVGQPVGRFVGVLDHTMLTARETLTRTDALTATLGYICYDDYDFTLVLGGGVRFHDDFGGQGMQTAFHKMIGDSPVEMRYEATTPTALVAWHGAQRFHLRGEWSAELHCSGVAGSDTREYDIGARLLAQTDLAGRVWIGAYHAGRMNDVTEVGSVVASGEDGLWLELGMGVSYATFALGYCPESGVGYGSIITRW